MREIWLLLETTEGTPTVRTKDQVAQPSSVAGEGTQPHPRRRPELSALLPGRANRTKPWTPTRTTYGVAQQDASYLNRHERRAAQIAAFFDRPFGTPTAPNPKPSPEIFG